MFIGAAKWFDNNKGFGILALPQKEELFVHIRGFKNPPRDGIKSNEVIAGTKKYDQKRDSYAAHQCHVLAHPEDWRFVVSLLGKADTVQLQDRQRKQQEHILMELAARQLLKGKSEDVLFNMLIADFDSSFQPSLFIPYVEFLEKVIVRVLPTDPANQVLSRVFGYFGSCVTPDVLFLVWKAGKFRFIGCEKDGDYEIPEEVLNLNATEIGYEELVRIREYSFGEAFCSDFANALLDGVETMDKGEIDALVPYLDFLEDRARHYWNNIIEASRV